jgi:hypothetical protein
MTSQYQFPARFRAFEIVGKGFLVYQSLNRKEDTFAVLCLVSYKGSIHGCQCA